MLYDRQGVSPFIQLPKYSFFGDYQIIFNLYSNFVVKCGGQEDYSRLFSKEDRTSLLCVSKSVFMELFNLFPKSKQVIQKRALYRRMVFVQHYDELNNFLQIRHEKMKELAKERIRCS